MALISLTAAKADTPQLAAIEHEPSERPRSSWLRCVSMALSGLVLIAYAWGISHLIMTTSATYAASQGVAATQDEVVTESKAQLYSVAHEQIDPVGVFHQAQVIREQELAAAHPDYALPPIQDGLAPLLFRVPTNKPVVFLTIDDGGHKDLQDLQALQDTHSKASLFLADVFLRNNPSFFGQYVTAGYPVENHSRDHILKAGQRYAQQHDQICSEADTQAHQFGRRPLLYRPPGGFYNSDTQRAAADCGMKAVIMWHAKAENGKMMYQDHQGLLAGDIVLMHFRPEFKQDLNAFVQAEQTAGLHTELLEDWLVPTTPQI